LTSLLYGGLAFRSLREKYVRKTDKSADKFVLFQGICLYRRRRT